MVAIVLLVYNVYYYHKFGELDRWYIVAFSLILGGAIGNLIDRICFGHVIDFIHCTFWGYEFPIFNIADSCITIGVLSLLLFSSRVKQELLQ